MGKERKILLLVLEGGTDAVAFSKPFENLINYFNIGVKIKCEVCRYDITITDRTSNNIFTFVEPSEVDNRLRKCVKKFLDEHNWFDEKDIFAVCSFHDLDACYCDDSAIKHHFDSVTYDLNKQIVLCKDVLHLQKRNVYKRRALDLLNNLEKIRINKRFIPYRPFYYSINLEHLLINNPNVLTIDEKIDIAQSFRLEHYKNPQRFHDFLSSISKLSDGSIASFDERFLYKHPFGRYSNIVDVIEFVKSCGMPHSRNKV